MITGPEYVPGGTFMPPRFEGTSAGDALMVVPIVLPAGVSLYLDRDGVAWETAEPVTVSLYLDTERLVALARTAVRARGRSAGRCRGLVRATARGRLATRRTMDREVAR
jgi:hypothetical protein